MVNGERAETVGALASIDKREGRVRYRTGGQSKHLAGNLLAPPECAAEPEAADANCMGDGLHGRHSDAGCSYTLGSRSGGKGSVSATAPADGKRGGVCKTFAGGRERRPQVRVVPRLQLCGASRLAQDLVATIREIYLTGCEGQINSLSPGIQLLKIRLLGTRTCGAQNLPNHLRQHFIQERQVNQQRSHLCRQRPGWWCKSLARGKHVLFVEGVAATRGQLDLVCALEQFLDFPFVEPARPFLLALAV